MPQGLSHLYVLSLELALLGEDAGDEDVLHVVQRRLEGGLQ